MLAAGCAAARPELWPAGPGQPTRTILVSLDTWHAMIGFPREDGRIEEWGYAERGWYLEGRRGLSGALRAMLVPSAGVVEVTVAERVWAERTPQPPAELFRFELSEAGYDRLRRHLEATLGAREPVAVLDGSRFYPAREDYHVFHHCHHYAAAALREAGLPVSPGWALSRAALAMQLRRAARMAGSGARP